MRTLIVATLLALLSTSAFADEVIGVVKRAQGPVMIERAGVKANVTRGAEIQRGDRVITGSDGYVSIAMRRTGPVTIGPESEVALDRFAADEQPIVKRAPPAILQSLASFFAVNRQR